MLCQSSLVPFFLSHSGKESFEANSIREIRSRTRDIFQFSRMQFVLDRMLLEMQTIERRYLAGLDLVSRSSGLSREFSNQEVSFIRKDSSFQFFLRDSYISPSYISCIRFEEREGSLFYISSQTELDERNYSRQLYRDGLSILNAPNERN